MLFFLKKYEKSKKKYHWGFSLIEMIVVLAIILIISSIILAQYAYTQKRHKLQKAAQEFALNVRWAQGMALETQKVAGSCILQNNVPHGFGVWVNSATSYKIFFNCEVDLANDDKPPKQVGSSIIYKSFNLANDLSFIQGGPNNSVNKDVFFLKPNPDCYVNGWRNAQPPNCALGGCYQNFTIQNSTGQSIIIKVDDGCRVIIQ